MNFKIAYINVFLIAAIIALSVVIVQLWTSEKLPLNSIPPKSNNSNTGYEKKQILIKHPSAILTYSDIVTKNLFSPKREEFIPEPVDPEPVKPESGKAEPGKDEIPELNTRRIKLYGTLLLNSQYRMALITNIGSKNRKHGSTWVKIGDKVDKFLVDGIYNDYIIVKYKGKKFSIYLYDTGKVRSKASINNKKSVLKKLNVKKKKTMDIKQNPSKKKTNGSKEKEQYIQTPFGKFKTKKRN